MFRALLIFASLALTPASGNAAEIPTSLRSEAVIAAEGPLLSEALAPLGAELGDPVYLRLFKEERALELWIATGGGYRLFKTYPICAMSGRLGPKLTVGDNQAPEGFYEVKPEQLNPTSFFHLAMNIGYPNAYDRAQKRTGSLLMIHGNCVSAGCYAMTDSGIEEIYTLVRAAYASGVKAVPVHIFPFRLTTYNLNRHAQDRWLAFWQELRPAYDAFQASHLPPEITVQGGHYTLVAN